MMMMMMIMICRVRIYPCCNSMLIALANIIIRKHKQKRGELGVGGGVTISLSSAQLKRNLPFLRTYMSSVVVFPE